MWQKGADGSRDDPRSLGRRAAEALNVSLVLDRTIYSLLQATTDPEALEGLAQVRILALMHKEKYIEQVAEIYAAGYSLDELKALVSFLESPAGESMRQKQPAVEDRVREATTGFIEAIMNNELS